MVVLQRSALSFELNHLFDYEITGSGIVREINAFSRVYSAL